MPLNSSKLAIFTLLVILISGCRSEISRDDPTSTITQAPEFTLTVHITPFQTPTITPKTPTPYKITEAAPSATDIQVASPTLANVIKIPDPEGFAWKIFIDGFSRPTGILSSPDQSGRMFVLEQEGLVHIIQQGEVIPIPFLDLQELVSTKGSTVRGLLGMVFDPYYEENGYFYVHYTEKGGDSVIARFMVSGNPNIADPNSETRLLEIGYPIGEHIGGGLAFGPDGFLYISIGDGGAGGNGDAVGNAQNPETIPGSLLRYDTNNNTEPEIWAYGLRNPWRFSFDALNGDLFIADVGENEWEEINYLAAGSLAGTNFGWNYYEGFQPYRQNPPANKEMIFPVWTYDHQFGCSVTGGYVYRGKSLQEWFGVYIYGDYCTGNIWGLLQNPDGSWQNNLVFTIPAYITSFGVDQAGEIYIVSITGRIFKLVQE